MSAVAVAVAVGKTAAVNRGSASFVIVVALSVSAVLLDLFDLYLMLDGTAVLPLTVDQIYVTAAAAAAS